MWGTIVWTASKVLSIMERTRSPVVNDVYSIHAQVFLHEIENFWVMIGEDDAGGRVGKTR